MQKHWSRQKSCKNNFYIKYIKILFCIFFSSSSFPSSKNKKTVHKKREIPFSLMRTKESKKGISKQKKALRRICCRWVYIRGKVWKWILFFPFKKRTQLFDSEEISLHKLYSIALQMKAFMLAMKWERIGELFSSLFFSQTTLMTLDHISLVANDITIYTCMYRSISIT
jgi:hypothetical protein